MKKARSRSTSRAKIKVTLVSPGEENKTVQLPKNSTVNDLLDKLDMDFGNEVSLYVGDTRAYGDDILENGDIVQAIGSKEGGRQ